MYIAPTFEIKKLFGPKFLRTRVQIIFKNATANTTGEFGTVFFVRCVENIRNKSTLIFLLKKLEPQKTRRDWRSPLAYYINTVTSV